MLCGLRYIYSVSPKSDPQTFYSDISANLHRVAHGIVCGMNYLHSRHPPVIHSDLKTENILVFDTLVAKVS